MGDEKKTRVRDVTGTHRLLLRVRRRRRWWWWCAWCGGGARVGYARPVSFVRPGRGAARAAGGRGGARRHRHHRGVAVCPANSTRSSPTSRTRRGRPFSIIYYIIHLPTPPRRRRPSEIYHNTACACVCVRVLSVFFFFFFGVHAKLKKNNPFDGWSVRHVYPSRDIKSTSQPGRYYVQHTYTRVCVCL